MLKLDQMLLKSPGKTTLLRLMRAATLCLAVAAGTGLARAGASVTLAWNASPDPTVSGYRLHSGVASRDYTNHVDVGNATTATLNGLRSGQTYHFAVTAYNQAGLESPPSGEIAYTVPAPIVAGLTILRGRAPNALPRLRFRVPPTRAYELQASEDLGLWTTLTADVSQSTNWIEWIDPQAVSLAKRFYRLVLP